MNRKVKVKIIGNQSNVQRMFAERGYEIVFEANSTVTPDLICFTGGEDISPSLYNENKVDGGARFCHPKRDAKEVKLYEEHRHIPKVGLCRGAQLLNVLSGGSLWQHVNNHTDDHEVIDLLFTKKKIILPSTHHQMMILGDNGYVLAASENVATEFISGKERPKPKYEPEVVWYPKTLSLCYQSHPEYKSIRNPKGVYEQNNHTDYFFDVLNWAYDL